MEQFAPVWCGVLHFRLGIECVVVECGDVGNYDKGIIIMVRLLEDETWKLLSVV